MELKRMWTLEGRAWWVWAAMQWHRSAGGTQGDTINTSDLLHTCQALSDPFPDLTPFPTYLAAGEWPRKRCSGWPGWRMSCSRMAGSWEADSSRCALLGCQRRQLVAVAWAASIARLGPEGVHGAARGGRENEHHRKRGKQQQAKASSIDTPQFS